jgi:hypothetical protein
MRTTCVAFALSVMAATVLTACGDDSGSGQEAGTEPSTTQQAKPPIDPNSPLSEQLAQTFPVPKAAPGSLPGSAAAIEAGRNACRGKTSLQVREEFIDAADLPEEKGSMVAELAKYENQPPTVSFVAGQIGAGVYEATLPVKKAAAGYQGCVYELALQLRRELAKNKR